MATVYEVRLDLSTVGSLNLGTNGRGGGRGGPGGPGGANNKDPWTQFGVGFDRARRGMEQLHGVAHRMMGVMDTVANSVFNVAKWGAVAGGGALFAGSLYGVAKLNSQLEQTRLSFASLFKSSGITGSIPAGLSLADETITKMRKDARELPGEFEDLQRTYLNGANVAFRAGKTPDEWRKLVGLATAAGVGEFQMDPHMVSREVAQLLEGRSGAHNIFGLRLAGLAGDRAKSFNKMSATDRFAFVEKELEKRAESLNYYKKTFQTAFAGVIDNLKLLGTQATKPLFEASKKTLFEINDWLEANEGTTKRWADAVGSWLVDKFERSKKLLIEYWPEIQKLGQALWTFGNNLVDQGKILWQEWKPWLDGLSDLLKGAMGGNSGMSWAEVLASPAAAESAREWLNAFVAAKGAFASFSILKDIVLTGSALTNIVGGVRLMAGAGGVGGAGAGAALGLGGLMATGVAAASVGASIWGLMSLDSHESGWGVKDIARLRKQGASDEWIRKNVVGGEDYLGAERAAVGSAFNRLQLGETNGEALRARRNWLSTDAAGETLGSVRVKEELRRAEDELRSFSEKQFEARAAVEEIRLRFGDAAAAALELQIAFKDVSTAAAEYEKQLAANWSANFGKTEDGLNATEQGPRLDRNYTYDFLQPLGDFWDAEKKKVAPKHPGGAGGTTVQKVEIVVTSNQNASRVARLTADEIAKLYRNPRISPYAPPGMR